MGMYMGYMGWAGLGVVCVYVVGGGCVVVGDDDGRAPEQAARHGQLQGACYVPVGWCAEATAHARQ